MAMCLAITGVCSRATDSRSLQAPRDRSTPADKKLKDFPVEANGQTDGYTLAFLLHIVSFTMAAVLFYCVRRPGAAVAGPR
jgi:hypothetical protein